MTTFTHEDTRYEWDGPLTIKTPITLTHPSGRTGTVTFGALCNHTGGKAWRIFRKNGHAEVD